MQRNGFGNETAYQYTLDGQIREAKRRKKENSPYKVLQSYEYNARGQITGITDGNGAIRYRYDCLDRLEQIRYENGIRTSYQYDADGNVSHLETRMGSDILLSFRYQYDGNGNRLMKTGIQGPATAGSSALDITYQYDVRGQLLEENRKDAVFRYSYDAVGNRIRKEETGENRNIETVYFYNEKNQLIHTEEFLEDGNRRRNTFTYSKQGSILREETESGISRYFYNSKNQQIRVECADGQIQENRYDAEGLRHEMRENGKQLRFVYQNGELLYEEGGDKETASCHLGAGIEAVRRGQRTYYYHPDEQLSTALITDETGTIKNQYRYDAFGAGLEVSEELPNRIRYTGQQYDEVTEQYYLRARYYNPVLGRFLQEDVYQGDGLNLYAYCRNNPVVYYDPSGYAKRDLAQLCIEDKINDDASDKNNQEYAVECQKRAQEINNSRSPQDSSRGTVSVALVIDNETGEKKYLVATNRQTVKTPKWLQNVLNSNEEYVGGPGHAEQTIILNKGDEYTIIAGGTSSSLSLKCLCV